ncbi:ABC transporter substrate-binding protein [Aquibacillus koreensis]|uniref:Thiamine pyrimidine synthase n=1 Tax=Aquibacillus koreensis TaxID=279446 RepID=A0A9X3WMS3_9BACI|nr:ABC transporter substrate-binding protein [Aquibacillus koreensis]MCT2535375.1 ABC transporter substrate-binding protein [Aquibacillus koreensis]MDC3422540.1 ABC transporter substrate-binding protein [Aquibacillus koreensis]
MMKRRSICLLFAAMLLFVLAACGNESASGETEGDLTPVKLQLKWVPQAQFAGYFMAMEEGYYEEEGLDVSIVPGGPDIVPEQQVANGAADIGIGWVASLLPHQEQGLPLVQIAQVYQKSGLVLVSKKETGISSPEDLAGKNVGNWMGGNEFEVLALFDKYGLDQNADLSFVKQGFTMDQFFSDEIDAASAMTYNEYQVVLAEGFAESDLNVIDMNEEGVAMLEDNLFANTEWLEDNKEIAAKFVRASLKGWQAAIDDPEAAVDAVMAEAEEGSSTREHQLKMMEEVAKLVLPEGFDPENIGQIDDAMFKQTAEIAHEYGVIEEPADLDAAYTHEIMEMVNE